MKRSEAGAKTVLAASAAALLLMVRVQNVLSKGRWMHLQARQWEGKIDAGAEQKGD